MFKNLFPEQYCGQTVLNWVRTSDDLPNTDRTVIVAYPTKLGMDVWVAYFNEQKGWFWVNHEPIGWQNRVLLWADLPEPRFDGKGLAGWIQQGQLEDYDV